MQLDDKLQQTEQQTQETPLDTTDGEAIMSDNKEANSNKNDNVINMEAVAPTGNEEDCTIIN
ncbi:Transcriptional regulator atrx [Temnothorax longispinosus]|uniref:Transcriptional regulator atrx n=3 Tax=Temnothorax longispinosus TaxID=300112 RepID=A0A4S2KHX8_9HYME|nr:Transcriptional regulator atrx [Temnothorax longispinosus]